MITYRCFLILLAFDLFVAQQIRSREIDTHDSQLLTAARSLFYESLVDKSKVDRAITNFEQLMRETSLEGKAQTYIGALYAIKGKHVFSPFSKMKWVNKGLPIMDEGIQISPDDIEALFIHGTTCYYLPFFFNRRHQANQSFKRIIQLLPYQYLYYEPQLILNMIEFLESNLHLTEEEFIRLTEVKKELGHH